LAGFFERVTLTRSFFCFRKPLSLLVFERYGKKVYKKSKKNKDNPQKVRENMDFR
jgi:hypothetical protein